MSLLTFLADNGYVAEPACDCDDPDCPGVKLTDDGELMPVGHWTCGRCFRRWSSPTPAARCLFEYDCEEVADLED